MNCLYCDDEIKTFSLYSLLFDEDKLCNKCREKIIYNHRHFVIDGLYVETFYEYNSLFRELLLQYKECYDEALGEVFLYKIVDYLKIKYFNYSILYVPSSKRKIELRGFNHLKGIYGRLNLKEVIGLRMITDMTQESKNYNSRLKMMDNYSYEGPFYRNLLIVDDVYTTGSSLRGVYKTIKPYCKNVKAVVLAKT